MDGKPLPFHGFNFRGCTHSFPLCTVQLSLFSGLIFVVRQLSTKSQKLDPSNMSHYTVINVCDIADTRCSCNNSDIMHCTKV